LQPKRKVGVKVDHRRALCCGWAIGAAGGIAETAPPIIKRETEARMLIIEALSF
jgi:hypothetical protein